MRFSVLGLLISFVHFVLIAASPVERRNATCKKTKVAILLEFQFISYLTRFSDFRLQWCWTRRRHSWRKSSMKIFKSRMALSSTSKHYRTPH